MTDNFQEAVDKTLKNEGGLTDDKSDPGGITNHGISLRFLKELNLDINGDGLINGKDIRDLNVEEAIKIYKNHFWLKLKIDSIEDQALADKVFDLSVNMGGQQAIKLLQEAINNQVKIKIQVDGIIGVWTIIAIENINISVLLSDYKKLACKFYFNLVDYHPEWHKFIVGWIKRANQ